MVTAHTMAMAKVMTQAVTRRMADAVAKAMVGVTMADGVRSGGSEETKTIVNPDPASPHP